MLTKTEAIILRSMKYRDTSKIVTFYTKEFGKLKGIAKGARSPKNKFGSALEPMSRSMLLIYKKEHRDLHLISQCDAIDSHKRMTDDLDRMTIALAVLELVNYATHDEERNPALFGLLAGTLSAINASEKNYAVFLQAFRLRLASLCGYAPEFETCGACGRTIGCENGAKRFAVRIPHGSILCTECCDAGVPSSVSGQDSAFYTLSPGSITILRSLHKAEMENLESLDFDAATWNEVDELLRLYMRYHFEGLKPLKSMQLFQQQTTVI